MVSRSAGLAPSTAGQPVRIGCATRGAGLVPGRLSGTGYAQPSETTRVTHVATADINGLELLYTNVYGNAGTVTDGPSTLTVKASVELTDGTRARGYTDAGSRTLTIEPGGMGRFYVPVVITKGTTFYTLNYVSVPAAGQWPQSMQLNFLQAAAGGVIQVDNSMSGATSDSGEGTNITSGGADVTAPGAAAVTHTYAFGFGPSALVGGVAKGKTPICVAFIGDSIITSANDFPDMGFGRRALGTALPYLPLSLSSEQASQFIAGDTRSWRGMMLRHCTHALVGYGRNDLSTGAVSLATLQSRLVTIWALLKALGIKSWQTTLPPKSSSTDQFATLGNQTTDSTNATRVNFNNWLRDGAPMLNGAAAATGSSAAGTVRAGASGHPLTGYIELADAVESSRDSGLWAVDRVRTITDAQTVTTNFQTKLQITSPAQAQFSSADVGKHVAITGAGSAGAMFQNTLAAVDSATVARFTSPISTAVSGGTARLGMATSDGIHPSPDRHASIAALIPTSMFS